MRDGGRFHLAHTVQVTQSEGVFGVYLVCYVCVGGGVSRPVSALYGLSFRSLETSLVVLKV